jgi:RimJ/RimL family protein N-acetyltransferase
MRREAEFLKDRFMNAEWASTVWYAILDEEYLKSRSSLPRTGSN